MKLITNTPLTSKIPHEDNFSSDVSKQLYKNYEKIKDKKDTSIMSFLSNTVPSENKRKSSSVYSPSGKLTTSSDVIQLRNENTGAFDYVAAREELLKQRKDESNKLKQGQNRMFYENNLLISKLKLKPSPSEINMEKFSRNISDIQHRCQVRTQELNYDKEALNSKIFDTNNLLERLQEQRNYANKYQKDMNTKTRFNIFKSRPETTQYRDQNKNARDSLHKDTISLTLLRNETKKFLSDITDVKNQYQIKIDRVEKDISHVKDQTRTLR